MRPTRLAWLARPLVAILLAAGSSAARATPLDFLPVGEPLEDELRVLEILAEPIELPHLGTRPLQLVELPRLDGSRARSRAAAISSERVWRRLARDLGGSASGTTPRLLQWTYPDQQLDVSVGLEGGGIVGRHPPQWTFGSGLHTRLSARIERWGLFSHLIAGHVDEGLLFAEALLQGKDLVLHSEEGFLTYSAGSGRWVAQLGRSRWHWGPGEEGSLLLSKTSAPMTGLALRMRLEPLRLDGMILSATLDPASGEQLAAHRLEWHPRPGLRLGLAEAARYQASAWQPLYLVGVLPYALVETIQRRDATDSSGVLRNNVLGALDIAWVLAPGSRLYGELLIDDFRAESAPVPHKYAYQLGWEGVGMVRGTRVTWGTEYTRLTRFVYTSFFDRVFESQGRPLGFPTGPDARRARVRLGWDLTTAWQLSGAVARTERGESGIDVPFLPGLPPPRPTKFAGVVERSREIEVAVRYWPASGVDLALLGGYRWVANLGHESGAARDEASAAVRVRLVR